MSFDDPVSAGVADRDGRASASSTIAVRREQTLPHEQGTDVSYSVYLLLFPCLSRHPESSQWLSMVLRHRLLHHPPSSFLVSRFGFEQIDLATTSLLANQPVTSESRDKCQKCSRYPDGRSRLFVPVSHLQTFNCLYCYRQPTVSIVVSAIAIFRLIGNIMPSCLPFVYLNCFKLKLFANSNRDTRATKFSINPPRIRYSSSCSGWLQVRYRPTTVFQWSSCNLPKPLPIVILHFA